MFSHRVHLVNGGAGSEKEVGDRLLVGEGHVFDRSRPKCRTATGYEANEQIFGAQGLSQLEHEFSAFLASFGGAVFVTRAGAVKKNGACFSGFGIRNIDPPGQPVAFRILRPEGSYESPSHLCSRLACADHGDALGGSEFRGPDLQGVTPNAYVLSDQVTGVDGLEAGEPDRLSVLDEPMARG